MDGAGAPPAKKHTTKLQTKLKPASAASLHRRQSWGPRTGCRARWGRGQRPAQPGPTPEPPGSHRGPLRSVIPVALGVGIGMTSRNCNSNHARRLSEAGEPLQHRLLALASFARVNFSRTLSPSSLGSHCSKGALHSSLRTHMPPVSLRKASGANRNFPYPPAVTTVLKATQRV